MNYQQNLENHNNLISNITNVVTDIDNIVQNLPAYKNTYATATPNDILENKTAVVNGVMVTGIRPDLNNILNQQDNIVNSIQNNANIITNVTNLIPQVRELNPNIRFSGSNDTILNFHNFIISPNANDMSNMFSMMHNTTVNMTTLNTINITNMAYMFNYIERYCNIYTNNLDTRNVTNMSYMFAHFAISSNFYGTIGLNTTNVIDMSYMFHYDNHMLLMQNMDLANFDVSNVVNMSSMFDHAFVSGNLSNWRVNNVVNMYSLFNQANFSNVLGFNSWNICNVNNTSYMFYNVTTNYNLLKQIQKWNFNNLSQAVGMFQAVNTVLENNTIDLRSSLKNVFKIANTHGMFALIPTVNTVNLSGLQVNNCIASNWFNGCKNLKDADLSNMTIGSNANLRGMFNNCVNLNSVNFANINITSTVTNQMVDVNVVKYIDISNYQGVVDISNFLVLDLSGNAFANLIEFNAANSFMSFTKSFTNRRNLRVINTTNTKTNTVNFVQAFNNCRNLITITDYNFIQNLNNCNFEETFNWCSNLQDNISICNISTAGKRLLSYV